MLQRGADGDLGGTLLGTVNVAGKTITSKGLNDLFAWHVAKGP